MGEDDGLRLARQLSTALRLPIPSGVDELCGGFASLAVAYYERTFDERLRFTTRFPTSRDDDLRNVHTVLTALVVRLGPRALAAASLDDAAADLVAGDARAVAALLRLLVEGMCRRMRAWRSARTRTRMDADGGRRAQPSARA